MKNFLIAYLATAVTLVGCDMLWLGIIAKPFYQEGIGHLLAAKPIVPIALLFYAVFACGLVAFAVTPQSGGSSWSSTLRAAALFGFFTYMTYDLTNLATLRDWPVAVSILDLAWGTSVSVVAAAAGKAALDWASRG